MSTRYLITKGEARPAGLSSRDLVMAWATDCDTNLPRYILQLDAAHRGNKSNCKCSCCGLPVQAVNAATTEYHNRPHFRHPAGSAKDRCIIVAARRALEATFAEQDLIVLPRQRRSAKVEGLSGKFFDAWVEQTAEKVRISSCSFRDDATALLTLDDGRQLVVRLTGRGDAVSLKGEEGVMATIELSVEDPEIAMMSPEDIFRRLELAWQHGTWCHHWNDAELDRLAEDQARAHALAALDWMDEDATLPEGLTPAQRRETLLHREVKAIIEREKRIMLPPLDVTATRRRKEGTVDTRSWSSPEVMVNPTSVRLEVYFGNVIPDIVIDWTEDGWAKTVLIEVTVTNPITEERIERLSSLYIPAMEIDIGRMGGVVTRSELTRLVVEEVAGKRWLFHPVLTEEHGTLMLEMADDEQRDIEARRQREAILQVPASEWAERFLDAFLRRWEAQREAGEGVKSEAIATAQDDAAKAIIGLEMHGYPLAVDLEMSPLRAIVARILSIKLNMGVEYKFDNAWGVINAIRCDQQRNLTWHTLYLIALRIYQPVLTGAHQAVVATWRDEIRASIEAGNTTYIRDTCFDRLLGRLFPEMREGLQHSFGTAQLPTPRPVKNETRSDSATPFKGARPPDLWLHGKALEQWEKANPEAAAEWRSAQIRKR